jgi:hypothetical protein
MKNFLNKRALIVLLLLTMIATLLKSQTSFIWGKQFGSEKDEYALNHVIDNLGNIYVSGKTNGMLDGKNRGYNDGFITKIDSLGNTVWTRQFGSEGDEDIQWSAIDNKGCVYITGSTTGVLDSRNFGKEDIFVVKYNPAGNLEWTRQLGTDSTDVAKGIYADNNGGIYLTGMTGGKLGQLSYGKTDCIIIKLHDNGNQIFTYQFGTSGDDYGYSITGGPDSEIFICGSTWGDFNGKNKGFIDGFTGQFSSNGKLIRYNQFGTDGFDIALILSVDNEKNIYLGGTTMGNMGCQQIGEGDAFILKMTEKGEKLWNNQFGTRNHDSVRGLNFNSKASDNILISGIIDLPPGQAFIRMYSRDGVLLWEQTFAALGKNGGTSGKDITIDNKGNIYHMGLTGANLFGSSFGEHDVYLVKYKPDKSSAGR